MAGVSPKATAVTIEIAAANASTRPSTAKTPGSAPDRASTSRARNAAAHRLSTSPAAAPRAVSTRLSARHCRTSRPVVAPSEMRIATSRVRPAARASSRFATFAHVTSSTTATIAASANSASANRARSPEKPRANGSATSRCAIIGVLDAAFSIRLAS